jgi:TolB protein
MTRLSAKITVADYQVEAGRIVLTLALTRLVVLVSLIGFGAVGLAGWIGQAEPAAVILYQAAADQGNDLQLVDARRGLLGHLTRKAGDESFPAWSPDGRQVVYFARREGGYEMRLVDFTGRLLGQMPVQRGDLGYPAWSPDGRAIVYSDAPAGQAAIYRLESRCLPAPGTCQPEALVDTRGELLQWSPDGTQLVFVSDCENNCDVYLLSLASGQVTALTRSGLYDLFPAWSPDGKRIIFMSSRRISVELYLVSVDCVQTGPCEDQLQPVTANLGFDGFPVWSPDGQWVVFSTDRDGGFNLYRVAVDCVERDDCERRAQPLTQMPGDEISPAWSPDGEWIAFVADRRLAVMRAGGGPARYLMDGVQPNQTLLWQPG